VSHQVDLRHLERCFGGAIPAVLSTASADGVPNVTFISKAHRVDDERIALSNQFMSKTARNLAANPRACVLLIDPATHEEYRLSLVYERTERRGHVFEKLRAEIDALAALTGMQHVFRLRAADVFRVLDIAEVPMNVQSAPVGVPPVQRDPSADMGALAELSARIGRCTDLDVLVETTLDGLDRLLGYSHVHVLLLDEEGRRLYTIGSHGFSADSVGAEVVVGEGFIGGAAARCEPARVGNLRQMAKYSASIRRGYIESGVEAGREIPMPGLPDAESRLVVPAMALGQLIGVLVADSEAAVAFGAADEQLLGVVATLLANAVEHVRALERDDEPAPAPPAPTARAVGAARPLTVRFFAVDGSTFLDGDYLIKGVAGRILWSLLRQHTADGRVDFTNKELRLDSSLDMPGFKDNLESRLILLKRRLDERGAPVRIEKTGRGRFRLHVESALRLDAVDTSQ
jgi:predicted pyridoxine 5'-phosphate oxidase superfamily flavin-nucleotide-binding protein